MEKNKARLCAPTFNRTIVQRVEVTSQTKKLLSAHHNPKFHTLPAYLRISKNPSGGHKRHASVKRHNECTHRPHLLFEEVLSKNLHKYTPSSNSKQIKTATWKLFPKQSRGKQTVWAASHVAPRHTCSKNSMRTELKRNVKSF